MIIISMKVLEPSCLSKCLIIFQEQIIFKFFKSKFRLTSMLTFCKIRTEFRKYYSSEILVTFCKYSILDSKLELWVIC